MKKNRVAIYCRLSKEDQDKEIHTTVSESIQNQKNLLIKYAMEKDFEIYEIYSDDDYSGLDTNRPAFQKMISDAEEGRFDIILCKHQSRFSRESEVIEKYLHKKFIEWKIRFISLVDLVDTNDKANKKSRQINGLINEWYSEDISNSIRTVFRSKQENGQFIGSFAPYGYKKDGNKLLIDDEASKIVKRIFSLYLDGNGTQKIASILNKDLVLNPCMYKKQEGLNYTNTSLKNNLGLWNKTTVKRILKNEVYVGNMVQNKLQKLNYKSKKRIAINEKDWIVVKNTHEAIIDKKTFDTVNKRLKSNIRSSGIGKAHVFASKVFCAECRSVMQKNTVNNISYLRCKLHSLDKSKCKSVSIRLDLLEEVVLTKIKNYLNYIDENETALKLNQKNNTESKVKQLQKELNQIIRDITDRENAIKNLYLDKIKNVITEQEYISFKNSFSVEIETLKLKESNLNKELDMLQKEKDIIGNNIEIVKKYKNLTKLTTQVVTELIDYIKIYERDTKSKQQKIKIHWLF